MVDLTNYILQFEPQLGNVALLLALLEFVGRVQIRGRVVVSVVSVV